MRIRVQGNDYACAENIVIYGFCTTVTSKRVSMVSAICTTMDYNGMGGTTMDDFDIMV